MTGPEHYAEAERLLTVCAGDQRGSALDAICTAAAQVHATLALTAAQAILPQLATDSGFGDFEAWYKAAGVTR